MNEYHPVICNMMSEYCCNACTVFNSRNTRPVSMRGKVQPSGFEYLSHQTSINGFCSKIEILNICNTLWNFKN